MSAEANEVAIAIEAAQISVGYVVGAVGVVVDAGRHAALAGRRVLLGMRDACGECDVCRRGGAPVCPHGQERRLPAGVTHVRAAARWLVALDGDAGQAASGDDGLELPGPAAAAIPHEVALAYTLYARTGVAPNEPVLVCGGDAVARFLVEILIAKGIAPVVVADPSAGEWCAWLAARGASVAEVASGAPLAEAHEAVLRAMGRLPALAKAYHRPWRVIATDDVAFAATLANARATLTVRAGASAIASDGALARALAREITMLGVADAHPDLVLETAALVAKGEIDLAAGVVVRYADEAPARDRTRADVVRA